MNSREKRAMRMMMALTACGFILYGTARGELDIIWNKAVHICLECIGLG